MTQTVPATGDPYASRVAYVGARPGPDELVAREPFVGPSGNLLWGLSPFPRASCYVTNVRRDYSASNPVPTRTEIMEAMPLLRVELDRTNANLIIALGAQALFALTQKESIESWRGSVIPSTLCPGRKVLATWHPAACLRNWPYTYIVKHDLKRAIDESTHPDIIRRERQFFINPTLSEALEFLDSLGQRVSIDIETYGSSPDCVGLSDRADRAMCIPFIGGRLGPTELGTIWRRLDTVFRTREIIGQNIQFDTTRLERLGFKLFNLWFDTMLAHHLLWPEFAHDLGFIVSMYTREPYYKHEIAGTKEERWIYNCKDAAYTKECAEGLELELERAGLTAYFHNHIMALIRPVMAMQSRGFYVDYRRLHAQRQRLELETQLLQMQLNAEVGFSCNVRSPTDLRYLLYEALGLRQVKQTKKGAPSTDEETLRKLAYTSSNHAHLFKRILDIRERRTLCSSFLNLECSNDGRYKANYLIHGTDSGRLSSRAGNVALNG